MINPAHLYKLAARCSLATAMAYLLVMAVFKLTWLLPLDNTERWLTAIHFSAVTILIAMLWALVKYRLTLLNAVLLGLGAAFPTLFIIWAS